MGHGIMSKRENQRVREGVILQKSAFKTGMYTVADRSRRYLRYIKSSDLSVVVCSLLFNMFLVALLGVFYVYAVCRLGFLVYQIYAYKKSREKEEHSEAKSQTENINITSPLGFSFTISSEDGKYFKPHNFILMTDIVKSTYYMKHHQRGMKRALRQHFKHANSLLRQFDGFLTAVEGDSLICIFTDLQNAVSFGNKLSELSERSYITGNECLQLRCLIHQGRLDIVVMHTGVLIVGRTVAEAYVLCDNAKSGVLTISDHVYGRYLDCPGSTIRSDLKIEKINVNEICKYLFNND